MSEKPMSDCGTKNTDRELWREIEGDYYSPSIHVTEGGGVGVSVGGFVVVLPIRGWHELLREVERLRPAESALRRIQTMPCIAALLGEGEERECGCARCEADAFFAAAEGGKREPRI